MVSVCVIGAGAAGLITAKTLLDDEFKVTVLTRDASPGGIWAEERVYPGLSLNNVHGEFRFSSLPMPAPENEKATGGRLTGDVMQKYMESFADHFLKGRIRYRVDVLDVSRDLEGKWFVRVKDLQTAQDETLAFDKVVFCTGGCSQPNVPHSLSSISAQASGFAGTVFHSCQFKANLTEVLDRVDPKSEPILIVGGGKSAQDIAAYLVNAGRNVTMVFDKTDAFIAAPIPLPDFIRKSRFLAVLSPYITLRTRLERFLHTTVIGSALVRSFWNILAWSSFLTFSIPADSPWRRAHSIFWDIRLNDEGVGSPAGFFSLLKEKKINVISPARVEVFSADGKGVILSNGKQLDAAAVILCTGFASSWDAVLSEEMRKELGLPQNHPDVHTRYDHEWDNYLSLADPPFTSFKEAKTASSIYRGIVPALNIDNRDFAVNGSIFTVNNGYTFEVVSHWISSYFLGDKFLRLPASTEDAVEHSQRTAAWLRKRFPRTHMWVNESYSSALAFFNYPQLIDDLLEDMSLPIMRGGGGRLSWPFKVIDLREIENLHIERKERRDNNKEVVHA